MQSSHTLDAGFEFQAYPTGIIPGIRFEVGLDAKNSLSLRTGYQIIRHGDAGIHDDERGDGLGFSLGYRRYFNPYVLQGIFIGLRNDLWFNTIDWKDEIGTITEDHGTSKIIVLQPTVETGYAIHMSDHKVILTPTIAIGVEINVHTMGAPVGEGLIILGGFNAAYRF